MAGILRRRCCCTGTGACCVNTTCIPGVTLAQCGAQGGLWLGAGTLCVPNPCACITCPSPDTPNCGPAGCNCRDTFVIMLDNPAITMTCIAGPCVGQQIVVPTPPPITVIRCNAALPQCGVPNPNRCDYVSNPVWQAYATVQMPSCQAGCGTVMRDVVARAQMQVCPVKAIDFFVGFSLPGQGSGTGAVNFRRVGGMGTGCPIPGAYTITTITPGSPVANGQTNGTATSVTVT